MMEGGWMQQGNKVYIMKGGIQSRKYLPVGSNKKWSGQQSLQTVDYSAQCSTDSGQLCRQKERMVHNF